MKYFFVKEKVQKQRISIKHISINLMIDDPLIEGLLPKTFIEQVEIWALLLIVIVNNSLGPL